MWIIKIKLADVTRGLQSLIYLSKCLRSQQMCVIIIIIFPMKLRGNELFVQPEEYLRKIFRVKVLFGYSASLSQYFSITALDRSPVSRFSIVGCPKTS